MKITHVKFIKLLAAELGQDEKMTGIHLNGLISEIINTTEEGKPFKIDGFGTFHRNDGALKFEPDERLAAEVNYNYEGMPEIDVNEAKSVVDEDAERTDSKLARKSNKLVVEDAVAEGSIPNTTSGGAELLEEYKSDDNSDINSGEDPFFETPGTKEAESSELADSTSKKITKKPVAVAKVGNIVGKKTPPVVVPASEKGEPKQDATADINTESIVNEDVVSRATAAKERPLPGDKRQGKSSMVMVLSLVAATMLIAAGVWWYMGAQPDPIPTAGVLPEAGLSQAMLDEVTDAGTVPEDPAAEAEPVISESELAVGDASNWEEPQSVGRQDSPLEPEIGEESAAATRFGLRGQAQPMEGRVFSIVVHSLPSRVEGNIQCDEIARLGLRCVVVEASVNNRITYRVGIGQFQTFAEAQRQVAEIPEPYRSQNFPARIN
jgi:nucleoid DNA-binding protein